ncbi:Thioredoxin [Candidatus Gugararchaeum adminiculabundum]|nr:Thioredoxin [Candidatus Gugararchaeum adminiculabundum]
MTRLTTTFVELLTSPNCIHSPRAARVATQVIKEMEAVHFKEISMVTDYGKEVAQEYGVDRTPAFAINGRIAYIGVPTPEKLRQLISEAAYDERSRDSYFF